MVLDREAHNFASSQIFIHWLPITMQRTQAQQYSSLWITLSAMMLVIFFSIPTMAATTDEIDQWLQSHNNLRRLHGVSALTWSKKVAASAQVHADTCPFGHSGSGYGESLAWATYDMRVSQVVQLWYDEEPDYDYKNPGFSNKTGHFTQIIWKATTEIGRAFVTRCGSDRPYVWVCQYNPSGNYIGQFAENVFSPKSRE